MTRIITHNNTRYRETGNDPSGCYYHEDINDGGPVCEHWELLPEIEDWPGHRPEQYLAKSPFPLRKGDLICFGEESGDEWTLLRITRKGLSSFAEIDISEEEWEATTDESMSKTFLSAFNEEDEIYLISRANPEHDVEDA